MSQSIALIHHYVAHPVITRRRRIAQAMFEALNPRGVITFFLMVVVVASIVVYISSLYYMFVLGFRIQKGTSMARDIEESNTAIDLDIQRRETAFAQLHSDVLQSMQKISRIRYLTADNVAISHSSHAD